MIEQGRGAPTHLGSAAMCTEGTASRPPTAKGLADIRVQENVICAFGVAQGPHAGPAAFPAVRVLAAPPQDNPSSHGPRRPIRVSVEKPQGWRASLALQFILHKSEGRFPGSEGASSG